MSSSSDPRRVIRHDPWPQSVDGKVIEATELEQVPFEVLVEWTVEGGEAVPSALTLRAKRGQPVTATAWRSVNVAKVIDTSRAWLLDTFGGRASERDAAHRALARAFRGHPERKRGGPPQFNEDHYRQVAQAYAAALAASDPQPVLAVVRAFGLDPKTDHTRAKGWVAQARKRGLIPPARERTH